MKLWSWDHLIFRGIKMKSARSKATDIPKSVKEAVEKRDHGKCIICGKRGVGNSHFIRRSQGGLGIEENVATMCHECHHVYDNGFGIERQLITELFEGYLQEQYPDWDKSKLVYQKFDY